MTEPPERRRGRSIPAGRIARLARFGGLVGSIAGEMLRDGATRAVRGERSSLGGLLLTPANAHRIADQLSRLRGAAMKMGQLLSMDTGDVLPPELAAIMARLRAEAEPMPDRQLATVLAAQWGPDWRSRLSAFDARPIAAASIGQVHRARWPRSRDQDPVSGRAAVDRQRRRQCRDAVAPVRPGAARA